MTLTAPRGFSGGPMADIDYGVGAAGGAWVEAAAALAVTQPSTSTRTVSVAPGNCDAFGIRVTNDAALAQAITAPGSGGAWCLLAVRFNWSTKTVSLQALAGPTTGSTTTPTAVPSTLPATMQSTPGTQFDLPLAWVWASSATTTLTLFDVRMRTLQNEAFAQTPAALVVFGLQFPPIIGMQIPSVSDGITYRWSAFDGVQQWRPWDSDWTTYAPNVGGIGYGFTAHEWRYVGGKARVRLAGPVNAVTTGVASIQLPLAAHAKDLSRAPVVFATTAGDYLLEATAVTSGANVIFSYLAQVAPPRSYFINAGQTVDYGWGIAAEFEYDPA